MKFNPMDCNEMFTVSHDGTLKLQCIEPEFSQKFLETGDKNFWYCSISASPSSGNETPFKLKISGLITGDNRGNLVLLSLDGKIMERIRAEKSKIHHVEFNSKDGNIFVTGGNDKRVCLYDVRNLKTPFKILVQDGIINSGIL